MRCVVYRCLFTLILCCLPLGCGNPELDPGFYNQSSGAGGSDFSAAAAPVFRSLGNPVTQTVSGSGGSVQATATDGTRFLLTVPPGALSSDTELTLTPVAVSGILALPISLPLAVTIGPRRHPLHGWGPIGHHFASR